MTRKSITTSHEILSCDVCGRRLLRGERADAFIAGGSRRVVCELCTARASNEGWIREGADEATGVRRNGVRRGSSLLGRLRQRAESAMPRSESGSVAQDGDARLGRVTSGSPARPSRQPRHVRAVPTNAELKMARALEMFNSSRHRRTVAGVARSLGPPVVAVAPSTTEGSVVTLAVSWELCWYRYEVDLADEAAGVRVVSQGDELGDLEPDEQTPNAAADEQGALVLATEPVD